ncbi:hypothetical protein FNF27_07688 [Cafeteria roenbergensis]|uniref:HSF-type DNA-binding domain-containing protein n=1 Tax=Cafeteria roenbergensis TaxID=33653 RepID=A0A5A8DKL9_CAFRO|nr:hypothetical protein FNF27_07688 [Cafeteria roenbergensis]
MSAVPPGAVAPFIQKLRAIVDEGTAVNWSADGTTFYVNDVDSFETEVLAKHFKSPHMASFVRQLNFYGFRKMTSRNRRDHTGKTWEFQHALFLREDVSAAAKIRRRSAADTEAVRSEGENLRLSVASMRNQLATARKQLADMRKQLTAAEDGQRRAREEAAFLRRQLAAAMGKEAVSWVGSDEPGSASEMMTSPGLSTPEAPEAEEDASDDGRVSSSPNSQPSRKRQRMHAASADVPDAQVSSSLGHAAGFATPTSSSAAAAGRPSAASFALPASAHRSSAGAPRLRILRAAVSGASNPRPAPFEPALTPVVSPSLAGNQDDDDEAGATSALADSRIASPAGTISASLATLSLGGADPGRAQAASPRAQPDLFRGVSSDTAAADAAGAGPDGSAPRLSALPDAGFDMSDRLGLTASPTLRASSASNPAPFGLPGLDVSEASGDMGGLLSNSSAAGFAGLSSGAAAASRAAQEEASLSSFAPLTRVDSNLSDRSMGSMASIGLPALSRNTSRGIADVMRDAVQAQPSSLAAARPGPAAFRRGHVRSVSGGSAGVTPFFDIADAPPSMIRAASNESLLSFDESETSSPRAVHPSFAAQSRPQLASNAPGFTAASVPSGAEASRPAARFAAPSAPAPDQASQRAKHADVAAAATAAAAVLAMPARAFVAAISQVALTVARQQSSGPGPAAPADIAGDVLSRLGKPVPQAAPAPGRRTRSSSSSSASSASKPAPSSSSSSSSSSTPSSATLDTEAMDLDAAGNAMAVILAAHKVMHAPAAKTNGPAATSSSAESAAQEAKAAAAAPASSDASAATCSFNDVDPDVLMTALLREERVRSLIASTATAALTRPSSLQQPLSGGARRS